MAGDWIKMRASLLTDPKVRRIGQEISRSARFADWISCGQYSDVTVSDGALRHCVTGALHAVWCAANEHARDGVIEDATVQWVDDVSGIEGFGDAMRIVGWLVVDDTSIQFPKFDCHNTCGAERQKKYRERKRDARYVTGDVTGDNKVTQEKRREEKRDKSSKEDLSPCKSPKGDTHVLFEDWWKCYPRRAGKEKAFDAWKKAGKRIRDKLGCTGEEAAKVMRDAATAFAESPKGKGEFCPYPATWLNQGRYDDDQETWKSENERPASKHAHAIYDGPDAPADGW